MIEDQRDLFSEIAQLYRGLRDRADKMDYVPPEYVIYIPANVYHEVEVIAEERGCKIDEAYFRYLGLMG